MPAKGKAQRNVGLARALSKLGYCSRSHAEALNPSGTRLRQRSGKEKGRNSSTIGKDRLEVDSERIHESQKIYLMLNKPRGVLTTASDERGRETIYDYLDKELQWVAPVGRLDKASEGLLLITNDPEWGARITAPDSHIAKTYHVQIGAKLTNIERSKS